MAKLRPEAADRLACVDAVQVVVACDALLTRMRLIRTAAHERKASDEDCRAAHVEAGEAALNLLSVLEVDGSQPAAVARLQKGLQRALLGARALFPGQS